MIIIDSSRLDKFGVFYVFASSHFLASGVCTKIIRRSSGFKVHRWKKVYLPGTSAFTIVAYKSVLSLFLVFSRLLLFYLNLGVAKNTRHLCISSAPAHSAEASELSGWRVENSCLPSRQLTESRKDVVTAAYDWSAGSIYTLWLWLTLCHGIDGS